MNRRTFLKTTGKGLGGVFLSHVPIQFLLQNILSSQINRANALSVNPDGFTDKKLITIDLYGGFDLHYFSLPLTPNGSSDRFQYNLTDQAATSMLLTRAYPTGNTSNPYQGFEGVYETVKIGNFYLPYFWNGKIPTSDHATSWTQASELANHMMTMRGMQTFDNHILSSHYQLRPGPGVSITGLVADAASTPIPAFHSIADGGYFKSERGLLPRTPPGSLGDSKILSNILKAFSEKTTRLDTQSSFSDAVDAALDLLRATSSDRHRFLPVSYDDRIRARRLIRTQFTGLDEVYSQLLLKYQTLVRRSLGPELALSGADAISIPGWTSSLVPNSQEYPDGLRINTKEFGFQFYSGTNVSQILTENSRIEYLPESMAIAEFMLLGGGSMNQSLSSSISVHAYNFFSSLAQNAIRKMDGSFAMDSSPGDQKTIFTDAHNTGAFLQLVLFTRGARAVASCIYELARKMKSKPIGNKNLFDQSVILLHSEFTRSAGNTMSTSDHGYQGCAHTVFSGQVDGPLVLGNIKTSGVPGYESTWGAGAPVEAFGNQIATIGNGLATVAHMLDLPNPYSNSTPFAVRNPRGKMASITGLPKNIGEKTRA